MTNLDSIFKSRDITLPTKVCLVKAMVFPVVMYGCESWTVKKAECRRIDAFELWCCRRLLRVPWTARRSNQSILKEINPGISLEAMMLKLKLQGRSQDGGGVGWGEHFLPHKFIKRAFKRLVNSTKQLLNAGRGHQAPRKATQLFERR